MSKNLMPSGGPGGAAADPIFSTVVAYPPIVLPAVTIAVMPAVTIAAMPNVTIAAMPNVTIAAMPDVQLVEPVDTRFDTTAAAQLTGAAINCTLVGDNILVAAIPATVIRIYRLIAVFATACTAIFYNGAAGTALTGAMSMSQYGSITLDFSGEPWFVTTAGNAFVIKLSAGIQVSGRIWYLP